MAEEVQDTGHDGPHSARLHRRFAVPISADQIDGSARIKMDEHVSKSQGALALFGCPKHVQLRLVMLAVVLLVQTSSAGAPLDTGVCGGSVRHVFADSSMHGFSCSVAIPPEYTIIDVRGDLERLVVTAGKVDRSDPRCDRYLSYVWQFDAPAAATSDIPFVDRKELVALDSRFGERMETCVRTVICPEATAIYVALWEGARTILFDHAGAEIGVDWSRAAGLSGLAPSYIRPITWMDPGDLSGRQLVCHVGEEGGDSKLLFYDVASMEFEVRSYESAVGPLGKSMLDRLDRGH